MSRHPVGVVLTGGSSRRMGTDKAFVLVDGRPLVVAVADALWEGGCHPVECQGGDIDRLAELGLSGVADSSGGAGPVTAIADVLARHGGNVVIAACDLPALRGATVRAIVEAGQDAGRVAVANADGMDHLISYWPIGIALGPDLSSFRAALDSTDALRVAVDPAELRNVNSERDL